MSPSQTQALQEVKDEVAKEKYGQNFSWDKLIPQEKVEIYERVIILYHTRLLAEAGKDVKFLRDEFYKENTRLESDGKIVEFKHMPHYVFQWFEEKVSALLAAKQAEIDEYKKTVNHLMNVGDKIEGELQEAKAEVERLKAKYEPNKDDHNPRWYMERM